MKKKKKFLKNKADFVETYFGIYNPTLTTTSI